MLPIANLWMSGQIEHGDIMLVDFADNQLNYNRVPAKQHMFLTDEQWEGYKARNLM